MVATRLSSPKSRHEMPGSICTDDPSRRARFDPYPRLIRRTPVGPNQTVPYGTVPVFARIPGNKLPGYLLSVPPEGVTKLVECSRGESRENGKMNEISVPGKGELFWCEVSQRSGGSR